MPRPDPAQYDLSIDLNRLDHEWREQPRRYFEARVQLADARLAAREAKAACDLARAELDSAIRASPDDYGLLKLTEAGVGAAIAQDAEFQLAQRKAQQAEYDADILAAYCDALETRRRALGDLVTLHGQAYFAAPQAEGAGRKMMEDVQKREVRQRGRKRPQDGDE